MLKRTEQVWRVHAFLNMVFKTCSKAVVSVVSHYAPCESPAGLQKGSSGLLRAAGQLEHPPGRLMSPLNLGV